ncbi:apolipoprotein C-I-like [Ranitomeya imitator]|uniref:apolipoprotein C-I-like n=1 Tax=Ranitomeya imitator TaxID=111125 RepID=UPI0037E76C46
MKLLLALSVVLMALAVLPESTSAETKEPSIKDQLKSFGETVKAAATSVGEQTKAAFEKLHNSEFATSARKIFSDGIEKIKNKFSK